MSIDPRLIERRREVAEDRARKSVGRLIRFLIVLGVLGAVVWLLLSPFLSVKEVTVTGIVASEAHSRLVDARIVAGTPMILIRADRVVDDLERDPWVRQAVVELDWPNRVVVRIEERVPVAWVETGDGWGRRAVDGVALPSAVEPDDTMPHIRLADLTASDAGSSRNLLGALEFADALPEDLVSGARVRAEANGELWAEVSGFEVRLGRPTEMRAKALSLAALLQQPPAAGSILTLIAPTHPAVLPAGSGPESGEDQP
ncbi:MAG: cell division protein FtsQ/DivIB [Acidimicrobiia bacterium]